MTRRAIGVSERPPLLQTIPLSLQHLFAMFGATVLVPVLFHINPATVLLFNGIGTLLYLFICKGKIPAYLGSSFAFISPVLLLLPLGYEVALGGFIMCGVLFCLVSFIVKKAGTGWLDVLFPPAAMGAIVAVIGLELAGVAAGMAGLLPAEGQTPDSKTIIISITTLAVTVLGSVLFRGFLAIIPILIGVLVGYALSFAMGIVDTTPIINAHWFALPTLYTPRFEWFAILTILPAALVVIAEHVGHLVVTANIVKKDLLRDPGLHRSMFANGLSTVISGFFGSTPNTTYGENIGVMAITRVYSTWVIGGAAIFGFIPMQDGSPAPGLSNITAEGWFPHGGLPILMTMVAVNFAFSGTELIGIAAGETENPRKVIPVAIRTTIARLIIFFIGTVFVLAALIPMQQAGVEKSPFVLVFEKVGIPYAADIFNFVILTAILSAANSGLYASGRMLWSLSNERTLPACFARVTKNGVPLTALSVSMLGGVLALFSSVVAPDTVFVALSAISGFAVVAVWLSICASHFVFRRRHLQQGKALSELHYRAPWYPLVPVLGFVLCLVACVGLAFDPAQRIALWCGLPFVALCYGAYFLTQPRNAKQEPEHVAE